MTLFSLLFFPGVLLHETSHYVMAKILGVRTGRFSLLPRAMPNGRLRLGYVETASTDWVHDALIGVAPLVAGGLFVAYAGIDRLGFSFVWSAWKAGGIDGALGVFPMLYARPDFWLWFYLIFAVSSTMFPSPSDRRSWLPLILIVGVLLVASLVAGAGPWLLANLAPALNRGFTAVAVVMGISLGVHVILLLPILVVRLTLSRLTGLQIAKT